MHGLISINGTACVGLTCLSCGATHAIPAVKYDACLEEGGFWYCPNGHQRGYTESASARREAQRKQERIVQENARLADELREAKAATEKVERKLRKNHRRIAAGVCPCCNRTFAKLAMHMKTKHPEFETKLSVVK